MLEPVNKVLIPAIAQPHWLCTLCSIVKFLDAVQYSTLSTSFGNWIESEYSKSKLEVKLKNAPPATPQAVSPWVFHARPRAMNFHLQFLQSGAKQKVKLQFTDSSNKNNPQSDHVIQKPQPECNQDTIEIFFSVCWRLSLHWCRKRLSRSIYIIHTVYVSYICMWVCSAVGRTIRCRHQVIIFTSCMRTAHNRFYRYNRCTRSRYGTGRAINHRSWTWHTYPPP